MIDLSTAILWSSFWAGFLYVISPGPAVLALVGIGASRGRFAAGQFVGGHLAGDTLWCGLAVFALIGAHVVDPRLFDGLALACGAYLGYLGWRGVSAQSVKAADDVIGERPLHRGVLFGLTNPKSYPVALAMFTALLANDAERLGFEAMPGLMAAAFAGFLAADAVLVWLVGTPIMRRIYHHHALVIIRGTGALFLFFAATTLWEVGRRLWAVLAAG